MSCSSSFDSHHSYTLHCYTKGQCSECSPPSLCLSLPPHLSLSLYVALSLPLESAPPPPPPLYPLGCHFPGPEKLQEQENFPISFLFLIFIITYPNDYIQNVSLKASSLSIFDTRKTLLEHLNPKSNTFGLASDTSRM